MYSALDKGGRDFRTAPWNRRDRSGRRSLMRRAARFTIGVPFSLPRYRRDLANWRRLSRAIEDHGDWAIAPLSAHEYGLLVHYTTPEAAEKEATAAGFTVESMTDDEGRPTAQSSTRWERGYFHVVAVKV